MKYIKKKNKIFPLILMKSCKNSEAKNNQQAYIFSPRTREREREREAQILNKSDKFFTNLAYIQALFSDEIIDTKGKGTNF